MSRCARHIGGFDYVANRPVSMTASEWQAKYPAANYRRRVENGETFYSRIGGRMVAEAYQNVPAVPA